MSEKKLTALLTGGAGFIGSHLAKRLVEQGYNVRILDNLSTGKLSNLSDCKPIEFVQGDIRDPDTVEKCCQNVDIVVHLAAQTSVPFSIKNPDFNDDVNIKGTQNLLNKSTQAKIQKFILISSCAVYGDTTYLPIDEAHPTNPISPYAKSKLTAEQETLQKNNQTTKTVALRLFNVYGPKQGLSEYSGVITKFIDRIKQQQPLIIYGNGQQTRDFIYVQDVVNAITLAIQTEKANNQIINIGTGKPTQINQLAETILTLTGTNLAITKTNARQGDIKQSYANITKAKTLLTYNPQYTLTQGLKNLLKENNITTTP